MPIEITTETTREQRFDQCVALLAEAVGHTDRATPVRDYCTGLLLPIKRKTMQPMAAAVAPDRATAKHQSLQRFITDAPRRDEPVLKVAREYALPALERHGGVEATIVDETGIPKQGRHSVGVARQYCGQLGKVCNCQVAVSLSLANSWASVPIAWQLYLPREWAEGQARRTKAGVPLLIRFRTKPQMALAHIEAAVNDGPALGVIVADAAFGDDTDFCDGLTALKLPYCVGIRQGTTVWLEGQGPLPPAAWSGRGASRRGCGAMRITNRCRSRRWPGACRPRRFGRSPGAKARGENSRRGLRRSGCERAHRDDRRSESPAEEWLLIQWPKGTSGPTPDWLSTLPPDTSLKKLVYFAKLRWRIERDYEDLKQEVGLGYYEGRTWRGVHHHATMWIAAYAFLVAERGLFPPEDSPRPSRFQRPGLPPGQRSGLSTAAPGAAQSDVDLHAAPATYCGAGATPPTLSLLPAKQRHQARKG